VFVNASTPEPTPRLLHRRPLHVDDGERLRFNIDVLHEEGAK